MMRADAADEDRIAIEQQVVGGNGGTDVLACSGHELRRFLGGDVLEDDAQIGETRRKWRQSAIDKDTLAIKDIHISMSHLAMYAQHHVARGHRLEHRIDLLDIGHPRIRVGGRPAG